MTTSSPRGVTQIQLAHGPATLKQVAARARVHPGTASRALNADTQDLVKPETVRRVRAAAEDLCYVPNQPAASLRTGRTFSVGIVIADLCDPPAAAIARGAEDHLVAAGYLPVIRSTGGAGALAVLSQLRGHHADGLILASAEREQLLGGEGWGGPAYPPAVWAGPGAKEAGLPAVSADYALGIRLLMDHLAAAGHQVIGRITGPGSPVSLDDLAAAAAAAGIAAPGGLARTGKALSEVEGRRCAQSILAASAECTALVATSDMLGAGCSRAVAEAGLSCPGDISVTGIGDLPLACSLCPPLTTVRLPLYRVGAAAAQILLRVLTGCGEPVHALYLPPKLITRRSSGPPGGKSHQ